MRYNHNAIIYYYTLCLNEKVILNKRNMVVL